MAFAGPWSDTALESLARCWFDEQGLPPPSQQRVIRVAGRFVACVDFLWEKYRTVCEVDGRMKYTELDPDGRRSGRRSAGRTSYAMPGSKWFGATGPIGRTAVPRSPTGCAGRSRGVCAPPVTPLT